MTPKEFKKLHHERVLKNLENIKLRKEKALPLFEEALEDVNNRIASQIYSKTLYLSFESSYLRIDDHITVKELVLLLKKYLKEEGWLVKHDCFDYTQYLTLYENTFLNKLKLLFH